jgi:ABC-2 type transport system ATP-binding protein
MTLAAIATDDGGTTVVDVHAAERAVRARGLVKRYPGGVTAVDGVDLDIEPDTLFALLGPNGAGKTTTVSMLSTLALPTEGDATVAGCDVVREPAAVRARIGVTFQETVLDDDLTGRQALDFHGRLYGVARADRRRRIAELLELVELEEAADRRVKTYSGGMKRRLELARGLVTRPQVLFLDEPTLGVDPQNRVAIIEHVLRLRREEGLTVILTTHYLDEAERAADRVAIIDRGRIVVEDAPAALIADMGADTLYVRGSGDAAAFRAALTGLDWVQGSATGGDGDGEGLVQLGVDSGDRRLVEVIQRAADAGFDVAEVSVAKPTLGDVFLRHTGRALRDR